MASPQTGDTPEGAARPAPRRPGRLYYNDGVLTPTNTLIAIALLVLTGLLARLFDWLDQRR